MEGHGRRRRHAVRSLPDVWLRPQGTRPSPRADAATITVEVDFLADNTWSTYQTFTLAAGETLTHVFPDGFHAHWVRVKSDTTTTATAQFTYGPADQRDCSIWLKEVKDMQRRNTRTTCRYR